MLISEEAPNRCRNKANCVGNENRPNKAGKAIQECSDRDAGKEFNSIRGVEGELLFFALEAKQDDH